ncbi:hypothetical protein SAMN05444397_10884 [Flavobacterium aquidurense]|uniref:Lipocalin-like domain-containing protein n=1 Tax=Flavobacterium frigidimaris TaxID=262320 RepID=A0ABX4BPQ2_FLAFR|nr:hypothetical protein [Flavobacterium frigidimaris]OXA78885.1 hypothetical protein B0A65_11885 [Flavobacterium frigidimaris]SDZ51841.1 hypothetical protein SAMN05444397_10884 [Flavobacterium aquidurense]
MKKIGLLIIVFISLVSCSNDSNSEEDARYTGTDYYGKWTNIYTKEDFTDQYVFNKDNTFTRAKKVNGVTTNLSGTFEIFTRDERPNFQLTYSGPSNLIYSCYSGFGGNSELLYIYNGYLENSAEMCDYKLTYKKDK